MNIFKTPQIEQLKKQYPLNIDYYKLKSIYDLEDAPYICLGINPVCKLLKIWFQPIKAEIQVTTLQPICRIKELINDAIQINELPCIHAIDGAIKIKSIELYAWLKSNGLPIHEQLFKHFIKKIEDLDKTNFLETENTELKTALNGLQEEIATLQQQINESKGKEDKRNDSNESPKTVNFLYEIIGALISNYCCINPSVSAESLPRNITGHIKRVLSDFEISRSDEAIRLHITRSFEKLIEQSPDFKNKTHFDRRIYKNSDKDKIEKIPFF